MHFASRLSSSQSWDVASFFGQKLGEEACRGKFQQTPIVAISFFVFL